MRRILLSSVAGLSILTAIRPALGSDPIRLGLGGRYMGAMGAVIDEDNGGFESGDHRRGHAFKQDLEIYLAGKTILDNGLAVGARIELEGQHQDADQIDAAYAYVEGGFGQLRLGASSSAHSTLCETAPSASSLFGADSPFFSFTNTGVEGAASMVSTCPAIGDKPVSLTYFSPSYGGFSFALGYAPDMVRNGGPDSGTALTNEEGQQSEILSAAFNFRRYFDGLGVSLGMGYEQAFDRERRSQAVANQTDFGDSGDLWILHGHGSLNYAGFTLGGAYSELHNPSNVTTGAVLRAWSLGAVYSWGAYDLGLSYGWSRIPVDQISGAEIVHWGNDELESLALTGSWRVGSGIHLDAMFGYTDYDEGEPHHPNPGDPDYDAFQAALGFSIYF